MSWDRGSGWAGLKGWSWVRVRVRVWVREWGCVWVHVWVHVRVPCMGPCTGPMYGSMYRASSLGVCVTVVGSWVASKGRGGERMWVLVADERGRASVGQGCGASPLRRSAPDLPYQWVVRDA